MSAKWSAVMRPGVKAAVAVASAAVLSLSVVGENLIRKWEGEKHTAYLDSVGVPTICVGSTRGVKLGDRETPAGCQERLRIDVSHAGKALAQCVTAPVSQGQYDALLSLTFNVGGGAVCNSTLVRELNAGRCTRAAEQFHRWVYAGGVKLRGLVNRRADEYLLFVKDCP